MSAGLRRRRVVFAPVPEALLFDPTISSHAKVLWGVLDRRIDNRENSEMEGCAFPGREWIASKLGVSVDTVDRVTKELEEAGWMQVERPKGGRRNVYTILDSPELGRTHAAQLGRTHAAHSKESNRNESNTTNPLPPPVSPPSVEQPTLIPESAPATSSSEPAFSTSEPPKKPKPRAASKNARESAPDPAAELARLLTHHISPCLSNNIRRLTSDIRLLLKDWTPAQVEAAARHPETRSWTFNALAFQLKGMAKQPPASVARPWQGPANEPTAEERAEALAAMRSRR